MLTNPFSSRVSFRNLPPERLLAALWNMANHSQPGIELLKGTYPGIERTVTPEWLHYHFFNNRELPSFYNDFVEAMGLSADDFKRNGSGGFIGYNFDPREYDSLHGSTYKASQIVSHLASIYRH